MATLTPKPKEELQERAQLVRVFEAACGVDYPDTDLANFRIAVAKKLGLDFKLGAMRKVAIDGPVVAAPQRPARR